MGLVEIKYKDLGERVKREGRKPITNIPRNITSWERMENHSLRHWDFRKAENSGFQEGWKLFVRRCVARKEA